MARNPFDERRGKCPVSGKTRYRTRRAAMRVTAIYVRRGWLDPQGAYVCPECGDWHTYTLNKRRQAA